MQHRLTCGAFQIGDFQPVIRKYFTVPELLLKNLKKPIIDKFEFTVQSSASPLKQTTKQTKPPYSLVSAKPLGMKTTVPD